MANFGQLILTNLGLQEQVKAQSGGELKIKRIAMGSGVFSGNTATLTALVNEVVSLPVSDGYIQNDAYTVEGFFSNEDLHTGFEWREIGVYLEGADGSEILYCYANAGDAYDYIPATEDERYSKYIRIAMVVGNTTNVSIVENEGLVFVDTQTFKRHTDNKDNPHGVTAAQIGAVPTTRKVNNKPLTGDIKLTASDIGAFPISGGALTGMLEIDNPDAIGKTALFKNSGSDTDYGTVLRDTDADGDEAYLTIEARTGSLKFSVGGVSYTVYGEHRKPTPADIGAAAASEHNLKTYTNLSQIGLSDGATLSQVARKLPNGSSIRIYVITTSNAKLAPNATNGWFEAYRPSVNHVVFQYTTTSLKRYIADALNVDTDTESITNWSKFATEGELDAHNQAASTITAGTFAGQVVANASGQAAGTSLLRNSRLVSADTNPTVNGEICWTYK